MTGRQVVSFWNTTATGSTTKKGAGRGYLAMRRTALPLADAALRACLEFHRSNGDRLTAALLAEQVWQQTRCADPAVAEVRASTIASGGRPADLAAALQACQVALAKRGRSTDPAWTSLETRAAQLAARARRQQTDAADRHGPTKFPRKPRAPRFLRAS
jgi:hypothetical protein